MISVNPRVRLKRKNADGAWLVGPAQAWHGVIELDEGDVISTVGCGDCLLAGVLDAMARDASRERIDAAMVGEWEQRARIESHDIAAR